MSARRPVTGAFQAPRLIEHQSVLRVTCKLLIPFIVIFAVYVITHGEIGPGGGFQGGVIMAAAFILYGVVFGADRLVERVPRRVTDVLMAVGVLLYAGVGLHNMLAGSNFLDYSALNPEHPSDGEALGMTLVEYGVGITVTTVFITLYVAITEPRFLRSKRERLKVSD